MRIPLSKPFISEEIVQAVERVVRSGDYILGKECYVFEDEFAAYTGTKHAILTSSGTAALFLILKALGVGPGDGVIVPSLTAFPTVEPIYHVGAVPVFVDVDDYFTMYPEQVSKALSDPPIPIKAILPVHLYGHPADMNEIIKLSLQYGVPVIEDCCQAHGASVLGRKVGSIGVAGAFSFYPSKNMTVFGDGGMITTSDDKIARVCRMLRDHGRREKYLHEVVGYNLRSNEIQAAVGRIQLKSLDYFTNYRRGVSVSYEEGLRGIPIDTPKTRNGAVPVYHLYVIQSDSRDALAEYLKGKGIQTGIHYPIPCHKQPAVLGRKHYVRGLEQTCVNAKIILSLPMFPEISSGEMDYVCKTVSDFYGVSRV